MFLPLNLKFKEMFVKKITLILTLFMVLAQPQIVQAERAKLSTLTDFVKSFSSFRANFQQSQPDESMFTMNRATGYVVIERPGKLFWVYQSPEHQEIIADGVDLWIYDADIDQATVRTLASVQTDFPMSWLLYNEPVEKNFDVIVGQKKNGVSWFNLEPKDATFFQSLEVAIGDGKLQQIWMYQGADNVTKVAFEDIEMNADIPASKFQFIPPKGVDVIGQASR